MEIREIKTRLSIQTVLNHYNLQPNRNNMLKCPFHEDDKPSMKIYPNTNTFNCFGCGANGDVIEFCTLKEGSKHKGLLKATELTGDIKSINEKPRQTIEHPKENNTEILTKIFTYFKNGLNSGTAKRATEYLESRGFSLPLLGEAGWGPGYNSGQFHHRGKLSEADQKACVDAGLLIPYNGSVPNANGTTYTAFAKECIMFPLKERAGNIVSLYGRSINESKNGKPASPSGRHFYTANRNGLYPGYPKKKTTKLILTEAIIDAATLLQVSPFGGDLEGAAVLACYGTNGLTKEHTEAVSLLENLQEIIFFFDGDKAGNDAIEKYQRKS